MPMQPSIVTAGTRRTMSSVACLLFLAVVLGHVPASAQPAESARPRQMIVLPIELAPAGVNGHGPIRVEWWGLELPDDRLAQIFRASFWVRVGDAHRVQLSSEYVGLENGDVFRYGGGRTTGRWTTRAGGNDGWGFAFDVLGNLTTGDNTLHPLSAQAPSVELRLRARPWARAGWEGWVGWWARRVSPPFEDQREAPRSWFPSPTGWEAIARRYGATYDWQLHWRYDVGGVLDSQWLQLRGDLPLASDLALQIGAVAGLGPPSDRSLDYGWTLGVSWRPKALATDPSVEAAD